MEGFTLVQPPLQIFWGANQEVHRKRHLNLPPNLDRLIMLVPRGHDHQNIHVAVGMSCAISMRAEQDSIFSGWNRSATLTSEPANLGHGNIRSAIVSRRRRSSRGRSPFATHATILPRSRLPPKAASRSASAGSRISQLPIVVVQKFRDALCIDLMLCESASEIKTDTRVINEETTRQRTDPPAADPLTNPGSFQKLVSDRSPVTLCVRSLPRAGLASLSHFRPGRAPRRGPPRAG